MESASKERIVQAMEGMLPPGERLDTLFYGTIERVGRQRKDWPAYLGTSESVLLAAVLNPFDSQRVEWTTCIPLELEQVRVWSSRLPDQYLARLDFQQGNSLRLRLPAQTEMGFPGQQEEQVMRFLEKLLRQPGLALTGQERQGRVLSEQRG